MQYLTGKRILVIDDEKEITRLIGTILSNEGAEVISASTGLEGLSQLEEHAIDLVLLDIMMPGMSGYDTCTRILELFTIPVIFLTALTHDSNIVNGLNLGAVDYVTKPFSPKVLVARINAALRYKIQIHTNGCNDVYRDDYLEIDLGQRRVNINGEPVHLTTTEYQLLAHLCMHAGQVVTFSEILESVWGTTYSNSTNYVHVYVSRLRKKIEPDPNAPRYLRSDPGIGYRLVSVSLASLQA